MDISVVIVSWNVKHLLEPCIQSLYDDADNYSLEIIVVDNNSNDGTVEMVQKQFPSVILIANKDNPGFAKGNNQGFKIATGKYIFILNPDTIVKSGTLHTLVNSFESDPEVGIAGPKLLLPDNSIQQDCARRLQNVGMTLFCETLFLNKLPIIGRAIEKHYSFPYDHSKAQYVEAVTGCAAMIKKETLEKIGGFYEGYLHCGEDLELSNSVNKLGLHNYYTPYATVVHYNKGSSSQASIRISINSLISNELFFKRCKSSFSAFLYKSIILYIQMPMFITFNFFRKTIGVLSKEEYERRKKMFNAIRNWKPISSNK